MEEIITDPEINLFYKDPEGWFMGLRYYLYNNILPKCLAPDDPNYEDIRKKLISEEAMGIWLIAFTHKSVYPNKIKNNEPLEKIGDPVMKLTFDSAMIQKYPDIDEYTLTTLNSLYISKPIQRKKSVELGLTKWLRRVVPVTIHMDEDMIEALFGALFKIGDRVIGKGNGYSLASNLMVSVYNIDEIDIDKVRAHPKSIIKEIIEKMRWAKGNNLKFNEIEKLEKNDEGKFVMSIFLPPKGLQYLDSVSKPYHEGGLIGRGEATDKKTATIIAYKQAADNLRDWYGITREWAFNIINEQQGQNIDKIMVDRLKADEYNDFSYQEFMGIGETYVQLIGIKDKEQDILVTVKVNKNINKYVLRNYANEVYGQYGKQDAINIIQYVDKKE